MLWDLLTLFHNTKYRELFSTKDTALVLQGFGSLLVMELRNSSRCYWVEHTKDSLWGLRKKRGPLTGSREPVLADMGANETAKCEQFFYPES